MKNKFFTIIISGLLLATNVSAFSKNIIKIEFQSLLKPPASPKTFSAQHAFKLNRSIESNSSYFAFAIYLQNELQAFFDGSDFYKISNIDSTILKFENKNSAPEIIDSVVSANLHITQPVWLLTKGNSIEILKEDFRLTSDLANEIIYKRESQNVTDSIIISYNEKELISGYKQFLYRDKVKNYFQLIFENLTYEEISDPIEFQVLIDSLAAMRYITKDGFAPEEEDAFVDYLDTLKFIIPFTAYKFNNDSISIPSGNSKLMLLDFSYASCLPCINAIPMLNAVFKKYKPTDLVVHWIDPVDFKDKTFAKGQFAKLGIEFEVLFDEQRYCLSLYNMNTYPETFLVETQTGKIVYHHRGYLVDTGIEKELMNAIDGYLKVH